MPLTLSLPHKFPGLPSDLSDLFAAVALTSAVESVTEKGVNCRRLKDQLDTLERETTDKLAQMEQYNKELKVSGPSGQTTHLAGFDHFSSAETK